MKKVFLLFFGVLFGLLLAVELYWYFDNSGNYVIYIQNQSSENEIVNIVVDLDNKQIFNDSVVVHSIIPKEVSLTESIGKHGLKIWRSDTNEIFELSFHLYLMKWVVIDVYENETIITNHFSPPLFQ